jgi:hypothetical protein
MSNKTLTKNYIAGAAIPANTFVKWDSVDGQVIKATAATDFIIGATGELGADAAGDRVDIVISGIAEIKAGGTITRGAKVTADSNGDAVATSAAAGSNQRVAGIAFASAVDNDIFQVLLAPSEYQG